MLAFIRKYVTSLPVVLLLVLVGFAFIVTGVGDLGGLGGGGAAGDLARAGNSGVSESAFLKQYDRVVARAREGDATLTAQKVAAQGGVEQVLDEMVGGAALDDFAAANGVAVSDRAIDGQIASIDAFRLGGKFDQATYQRLLAQRGLSERELRDGLRSELLRRQLVTPVAAGAQVPLQLATPYARLLLDVHEGAGSTVPAPAVPAPSDAEVATWFRANAARFTTPERRAFRYALLDRARLAETVEVSDAEIAADYAKNRESYGGVEQRRLSQVVLPDAARAKAFATAVAGGEAFAAAAQRLAGASAADTALGALTRDRFASATNAAAAAQVFAAAEGAVVGPLRTDFGFNVVRVDAIVAAAGRPLGELRPTILAKLRDAKAETLLADAVAGIEDGFQEGKSFADAVTEYKLTAVTVPPVARDGSGAVLPPGGAPVVAKAFEVESSDGPSVQEIASGSFAVVELGQVVAAAPPPLAQVRARVVAALTAERRAAAAKRIADAVVADVAKGTAFAAALASRSLPPAQPIRGRRVDVGQQQPVPPALAAFLTMGPRTARALPNADGSVTLIHVARIVPGDLKTAPPLLPATRQQLAAAAPEEIAAAFARAVGRTVGTSIDAGAVARVKARIAGDAPAQP